MADERDVLEALLKKKPKYILVVWQEFKRNKIALAGAVVVIALLAAAFGAGFIMPSSAATAQDIRAKFTMPGQGHPFGTDYLGRDMFARILHGARVSLTMGIIPSACSLLLGMIFGGAAVYLGGRTETVIMRVCDVFSCIPSILLALSLVAALGPGLANVMIAVTVASIPDLTRYVRSVILNIVALEYVDAARACGVSGLMIVVRHVMPNAAGPLILSLVSNISGMIMIGAGLSYLGLGVQPPNPEWGAMLAEGQNYFMRAPYLMIVPGIAIFISVLAFNLMGDGLRDALDPKLR
jgi:peptide/nickel transport system permease protein